MNIDDLIKKQDYLYHRWQAAEVFITDKERQLNQAYQDKWEIYGQYQDARNEVLRSANEEN